MKKINFKILALLIFASLSSCSDDSGDSKGTTTGNYWPMAVDNKWNFDSNGTTEELKLIGTATFNNSTYYTLSDEGDDEFNIQNWVTKKGATYYQKIADATITESGITITMKGYEIPIFKDDLEVNETWSGSVSPKVTYSGNGQSGSLPTKITYTGRILERDAIEIINSVSYPNVIKMSMTVETKINDQITNSVLEYWFAKDVGPIREYQSSNGTTEIRTLLNYQLN
jgi:hypothetical protein